MNNNNVEECAKAFKRVQGSLKELSGGYMANFFKNLAEEIENDEHERKVL